MSKIEELIKKLCPNGVEYKKLTDVANVLYGYPCDATMFNEANNGIPLIRIRNVLAGMTETYTTENIPQEYIIKKGDLLVGMDGNFHVGNWKMDEAFLCQRVCKIYAKNNENEILNGFLSHLLGPIMKKIENGKQSGTVKHLLAKDINSISIPIPPLEVQCEIVRILDTFTSLTAELTAKLKAELTARRKQYEYYRDMLLSEEYLNNKSMELFIKCNNPIKKCKLKNVAEITRGKRLVRSNLEEIGKFPVFQNSLKPLGYYYNKNFSGDKTCVISAGAAGKIFYRENDFWAADDVFVIDSDSILNKYIYYFLLSKQKLIETKVRKASVPRLSREEIERLDILIPNVELQKLIVEVLDKFQDLLSNTQGLLSKEISLRQKQYEYYRQKLLSFSAEK